MTIESVTFITDLDDTYPASGDSPSEGDNHIRNIKTGLGGTFANFTGIAVTLTEEELNVLDGGTAASATTLVDADRAVVNDAGTMKQVAMSDFATYMEGAIDTLGVSDAMKNSSRPKPITSGLSLFAAMSRLGSFS